MKNSLMTQHCDDTKINNIIHYGSLTYCREHFCDSTDNNTDIKSAKF